MNPAETKFNGAELMFELKAGKLELTLKGDYLGYDDEKAKGALFQAAQNSKAIYIQNEGLGKWDSTLVVILFQLAKLAADKKISYDYSELPENLQHLLHLSLSVDRRPPQNLRVKIPFLSALGGWGIDIASAFEKGMGFIHQVNVSLLRWLKGAATMRPADFWFAMEECSYKALGIVSLVSFMVGLILAFVGAVQLKTFGAQIYVASLVAIGMTRIMGAIMVGIIMAGRTGASYAATIGTMQVNEEIDALKTMGIPITDFLVLPRIISLVMTMPFLAILADFAGMAGGGLVGILMLGISPEEYWKYSFEAFGLGNFLVGLFHAVVYGFVIALCGCYYGVNCGRNADSVGVATTKAVVSAIVWMIVVTGIITLIFEVLGI